MPHETIPPLTAYYQARTNDAVRWQLWSPKVLEEAARKNKPIFLHIGYASCYWCERMAHEAFRHPVTIALIARYFIPVVVDRNQRPDLAAAYQMPTAAMTGKTGWPLNLFLTPEGGPYHGGTYFPPEPGAMGETSFQQVILEAAEAWENDRERVEDVAREMLRQMGEGLLPLLETQEAPPPEAVVPRALAALQDEYDSQYGGFGHSAKFPQPLLLLWLLRRAEHGDQPAREMALGTLIGMARGGIYDVLGGGFHQYADDPAWRSPRFEKTLPNNALLARAYTAAYRLTGEPAFRRIAERTFGFLRRELRLPNGLLASAQSGDNIADEGEGRYFMWTDAEVREALSQASADLLIAAYGLNAEPQPLYRALDAATLAQKFGLTPETAAARLEEAKARLLEARQQRAAPLRDDTAITAWQALAVIALAEAAAAFQEPHCLSEAAALAAAMRAHLFHPEQGLARGQYRGKTIAEGFLEDYAAAALAFVRLHQAKAPFPGNMPPQGNGSQPAKPWLYEALNLMEATENRFAAEWGYYDTPASLPLPFRRPQELVDGDTPSGNALAATLLADLAAATHTPIFGQKASALLKPIAPLLAQHPSAFPQWLLARERL